jgi:hypothetical protein
VWAGMEKVFGWLWGEGLENAMEEMGENEREEEIEKFPLFNNTYKPYGNIQIQGGYPTIYKLHKRGGEIIYYNGPRDNQSLFYWLQGKNVL